MIEVDNIKININLDRLAAKALEAAGPVLVKAVQDNFDNNPSSWQPLAPSTIKQRLRRGLSGPMLVGTGKLRESITFEVDTANLTVRVYSTDPIAVYQAAGTKNIPARNFFILKPDGIQAVYQTLRDNL